jgi:hypothetical protein
MQRSARAALIACEAYFGLTQSPYTQAWGLRVFGEMLEVQRFVAN